MSGHSYSLREAADMAGISLWALRQGCKNGTIEHQIAGDGKERVHRTLTAEQVEKLRLSREVKAAPVEPAPADEVSAAIAATKAMLHRSRARVA